MNKNITRILSVVLSVTMLAGSFLVSTAPVSAAPGDTQWFKESLPGKGTTTVMYSGSSVTDIEAADASVIYVANGRGESSSAIWRSTDAGQSFTALTAYPGGPPKAIAVAPDNTGVIGVVDTGVALEIVTTAVWGAVTGNITVTYVDQNNNAAEAVAGTLLVAVPALTAAGYKASVTLNTGDTAAIDVTLVACTTADSFTINAKGTTTVLATVTAGVFADAGALIPSQRVHVSNDAGVTWSTLPALPNPGIAFPQDIAVGPARGGTLLGREYIVALADPGAAAIALGDLVIIGGTATWATVGSVATPVAATYDFTSVVVSPNFAGDRCVVAVGTTAGATTVATVNLIIVNTATNTIVQNTPLAAGTRNTINFDGALAAANCIRSSDISLPTNFDPTSAAGRRAYVCISSVTTFTDNDVYRVDDNTSRALGAVSSAPVKSVAYSGTIDTGKLFMGQYNDEVVKFTDSPTTSLPTWTTSTKNPSGFAANPLTFVRVAKDYGTTNRVFAGTSRAAAGDQSALSISNDAGVSFNQEAFINSVAADSVVNILGIQVTADGKAIFMATSDGTYLSLWKCATPVTTSKWSRVFVVNNLGRGGVLRVNPDYASTPCVFLADVTVGGNIYVSQNGGTTFNNRMAPSGVTINPGAMGVQDANTVYIGVTKYVYKSTNGAWTWGDPVDGKQSGNIASIAVPRFDDIIVGGTNGASYSVDGGTTFTAINTGLSGAGGIFIAPDFKYTGNKTVYAAGVTNGKAYRYVIGTSTQWDDLLNANGLVAAPSPAIGITNLQDALYVPYAGTPGQNTQATDRTLNATDALGTVQWATMNVATAPAPDGVAGVPAGAVPQFTAAGVSTDNTLYTTTQAAEGLKLVVSSTVAWGGAASGIITVTYTDQNGGAGTGTATITALAVKDQEFPLTMAVTGGNLAVDVTGFTVVGGGVAFNKGDKFDIKGVTTGGTFGSGDNAIPVVPALTTYADKANAIAIYAYKDWLAVTAPDLTGPADKFANPVDPVSGRGDMVNISFKKMGSGTGLVQAIDVEIREKAQGLTKTPTYLAQAVSGDAPSFLAAGPTAATFFRSNTEYIWSVRAQNTASGDAIWGKWSAPRGFTVQSGGRVEQPYAGPMVTSPGAGAQNVDPKLVGFTWAPVTGATEYTVIVATDAALTKTVAGTPVKVTATSFQAANLEFETTYFYSVQATKPTVGPTAIGSFSTKSKPVPPVTTTPAPPVTPQILFPKQETPAYVWAIIVIGAVLIIAVIVLVVRTRRIP